MPSLLRPCARQRTAEHAVRVLAVYDGDAERSLALVDLVIANVEAALGLDAIVVQALDVSLEQSRRVQRMQCRAAEIVVGIDSEHLRRFEAPFLRRHRVFTLEDLTLTLEKVASGGAASRVVSVWDRGHAAFSRSVVSAACAARVLVPHGSTRGARDQTVTTEQYAPRLARALTELLIGRAWAP